jgi:hypothetical protein
MGSYLLQGIVFNVNYDISPKLDLSIEGMRSQGFSEFVFAFMLVGVIVFSVIIGALMLGQRREKESKLGEKLMFGAIILGTMAATAWGALQMLGGYLF